MPWLAGLWRLVGNGVVIESNHTDVLCKGAPVGANPRMQYMRLLRIYAQTPNARKPGYPWHAQELCEGMGDPRKICCCRGMCPRLLSPGRPTREAARAARCAATRSSVCRLSSSRLFLLLPKNGNFRRRAACKPTASAQCHQLELRKFVSTAARLTVA